MLRLCSQLVDELLPLMNGIDSIKLVALVQDFKRITVWVLLKQVLDFLSNLLRAPVYLDAHLRLTLVVTRPTIAELGLISNVH